MIQIYHFLHRHRGLLWLLMVSSLVLFISLAVRCQLTEDISSLLPKGSNPAMDITFKKLKVKDKIFVNAEFHDSTHSLDSDSDNAEAEAALSEFLERVQARDSANGYVESVLHGIDPLELSEVAYEAVSHAPAYLDFTDEEMDTLTSVTHIRKTLALYSRALDTDEGAALYDFMGYDPCGIAVEKGSQGLKGSDGSKGLIGLKGSVAYITPSIGTTQSREAAQLIGLMDDVRDEIEAQYPGVKILYHGQIVNSAGNGSRIKKDLVMTIAISLLLALILLGICFKRMRYLVLLLMPIGYGMALAMAVIYLIHGGMSLMALGIGTIVLGVAMSYVMHVLIHYLYTGDAEDTVRRQTKPVLMGSITTIGAFAGLLLTESPLLQDFGLFALLTVAGTTLASLIYMPHFFPERYTPNKRAFALLERMNATQIDRRKWLVVIVVGVTLGAITWCNRYAFDTDLLHIGYISERTHEAQDAWRDKVNGGNKQQYFAAMSPDLDSALLYLENIEQKCKQMKADGRIANYMPVSLLMPSLERQQERLEHWSAYHTPERQAAIWANVEKACTEEGIDAGWFEPYRMLMSETPEAELIAETGLIPDYLQENLVEHVAGQHLVFIPIQMDSIQSQHAREIKDELSAIEGCVVLDPFYYATGLVELTHRDFNRIMMISSIFVLVLLLLTYRNIWVALIAFSPVMLSWYAVLGAMALTGQTFNILNIVVSSFVFGIGVDYSIFIMDGLLHGDAGEHALLTMHKTAITLSATVLVMCMASLIFAVHPAIHSIAFCSLYGMITTMMLSYTLQPVLYRMYQHIRQKRHGEK